jgi:hypothetical protein
MLVFTGASRMMIKYIRQPFLGGSSIVFDYHLPVRASAISIPLKFVVSLKLVHGITQLDIGVSNESWATWSIIVFSWIHIWQRIHAKSKCWFLLVPLRMMIKYIRQPFLGGSSIVFDYHLPVRASAISIPLKFASLQPPVKQPAY